MKLKYGRILLKISGEMLGQERESFAFDVIERIIQEISQVHELGVKIGIVIGGGNIIRGRTSGEIERIDADLCGMVATIINGLMLNSLFRKAKISSLMSSAIELPGIIKRANRTEDRALYEKGNVILFVGGTGNPLFTTDTAAALRAAELNTDILIKGTKVQGVYSADPVRNKKATLFRRLTFSDAIRKNLQVMDLTAYNICQEADIPIYVYNFLKHPLEQVIRGKNVGTLISNK